MGTTQKKRKTQEEGERRDRTEGGGGATKEREETHYLLGENKKALRTILHNIGTILQKAKGNTRHAPCTFTPPPHQKIKKIFELMNNRLRAQENNSPFTFPFL